MEQIEITDRAAAAVERGVSWIFSNEIFKKPAIKPGAWCEFRCRLKMIGTGYANPHSLIFGRVLSRQHEDDIPALIRRVLASGFARRQGLSSTGAARLLYSEADFFPGLIIDCYADHAVIQSNTAGVDTVLSDLETIVPDMFQQSFGRPLKGLIVKADSGIRSLEGVPSFTRVVKGDAALMENLSFDEGGTQLSADLVNGQKTGFFLDQRENRDYVASLANGRKRILDLCCYSGGWGLRALTNGLEQATFVDESAAALKLVERGLSLNGIDSHRARLVESDVFSFLEKDEDFYDIVVADPPAFVKSKKNLPQAKKAYEKLNKLAWRRLKREGILVTCSCSYHLSEQDFFDGLRVAIAKEKGLARVVYRGRQAADHPYLLSMPETNYLKCAGLLNVDAVPD